MVGQNIGYRVYDGDHTNKEFKKLIIKMLKMGNLGSRYIKELLTKEAMQEYSKAFTALSADPVNNMEVYELLGDSTGNKFIVWYMFRRFPQLNCPLGVKIIARLKINYGSKREFYKIAEQLDFWRFISAAEDLQADGVTDAKLKDRAHRKKELLEDTLEAFLGCTEYLLDKKYCNGVGYAIVYDILTTIFDKKRISIKYEHLIDAKTRLKELFDYYKFERPNPGGIMMPPIGEITYANEKGDFRGDKSARSIAYQVTRNGARNKIGEGNAPSIADSEQQASEQALTVMKQLGYYRQPPPEYKQLLLA